MSASSTLRVGVIGAGRIGAIHAANLAALVPGAEVAAIADVNLAAAREQAARLNLPAALADYQAMLRDPSIQAVVICSPTDTHARIIEEAAAAGKHIFCEKPIDFDLACIDHALAA
ncbi:MAG: Gfo/Idh/MocA family oxidoreductase, partial [Anaerolineales bacterium]